MDENPQEKPPPQLLEYRRPERKSVFELRPPSFLTVPYTTGFAVGALATFLAVAFGLEHGRGAIPEMFCAGIAIWIGGWISCGVVTAICVWIRRSLPGPPLEALRDGICFWVGFGVGIGQIFVPFAAVHWGRAWDEQAIYLAIGWFLSGCIAASIALARPLR